MRFPRRRNQREEDLEAEIQGHLEMAARERIERGETPEQAARAVRREFGNIGMIKEVTRDMWGWIWFERLLQDLQYGWRMLRRSPGFTVLAVIMLGAALGASALMFSVIHGILLLPLPYRDPDRLVRLYAVDTQGKNATATQAEFAKWLRWSHSFESLAAAQDNSGDILTDKEFPEQIVVLGVTPGFFDVLGVSAQFGRVFQPQDFKTAADRNIRGAYDGAVVVLSHELWQRRYGADPNLVGQSILLNNIPVTVIGIMPADFHFSQDIGHSAVDCWAPRIYGDNAQHFGALTVIGRLRPNVSLVQAQAEMNGIAKITDPDPQNSQLRPRQRSPRAVQVTSLHESIVGQVRPQLLILFGAVIFVLITACANVANLVLARSMRRQREMAVRAAVGASQMRLFRQLLTESVLLCLSGGIAGILFAVAARKAIMNLAPANLPRASAISLDATSFGFTFLLAVFTGLLCGTMPALRASRPQLTEALKEGAPGMEPRIRSWLGNALLTVQIALALMLLIASGLMMRTYARLQSVPLGFEPKSVLVMNAMPPVFKVGLYRRLDTLIEYSRRLTAEVERVPGVESAAIGVIPIRGAGAGLEVHINGEEAFISSVSTTPGYFRTVGSRLIAGRLFDSADRAGAPLVGVVNQTAARKFWPGRNSIGQWIDLSSDRIQIIGLVNDVRMSGLEGPPVPFLYMPMSQSQGTFSGRMLVRVNALPSDVIPLLRKAVLAVDRDAALGKIEMLEEILDNQYAGRRFNLLLISIFGALSFVLATVGIYGTIAYTVSRRTHEIGIRMALGAQGSDVIRLIMRQGLGVLLVGEALGISGALVLNKLLASMVFQVSTTDLATYIGISLAWAGVAILANYIPSRKATLVDPLLAIRV
jgi:putative ABC transport system permease protein